jgi:hypothetical protein
VISSDIRGFKRDLNSSRNLVIVLFKSGVVSEAALLTGLPEVA